jgi:hypothetical protein
MESKLKREYMFREFLYKDINVKRENILKYYGRIRQQVADENKVTGAQLDFMVWAYDLVFFTRVHASKDTGINDRNMYARLLYPLLKKDLIYHHFHRFETYKTFEAARFREDGGHKYRVRFALSKRGVMAVERFYFLLGNRV